MENKPILFVINELLWSSSSESSDDSDSADENTRTGKRPRILNYVEEVVDKFSEREFRENFRLRRNTFTYVLNQLKDHISTSLVDKGHSTIDAKKQLLIALWYFATPDSYRSICSRFDIGKATGIRCVRRVTEALLQIAC
ncbi:cuticle protein [Holotrichia oblita]|uniref:Cuticle protein n=1 Tax=Holotrichia oblita TaxID=644536 RepID=A0ACB9STP9_HOLOL|nr:cuticle protein [Holotrichia oblita]